MVVGAAAVVVVLFGMLGVVLLSWFGTYQQAQTVQRDATALRAAINAGDWPALPSSVDAVRESSQGLVGSTQTVTWRLLEAMPVIGSSASALSNLAGVMASVSQGAEPLTPFAEQLIDGRVRTASGAIDVAAMEQAAPLLERFTERVESGVRQLDGIDVASVRSEVGGPVAELRQEFADVLPGLSAASEVAQWLPGMLGANGDREWLIMLQNPAEARGSGGFIGGYVLASAVDGKVTLDRTGTSSQLAGSPIPSQNAPADARETWGDALDRWGAFNVSPHFPMTAILAADGMRELGQPVNGVIAVDPETVASMLRITGPVTAMGKTITADDAAAFFTVDAYREYPDNAERDEITMALVEATFQALLDADWSVTGLVDALRPPITEERVEVWSADQDEQEWLEQTALGGAVIDRPGSVVAVAFNNSARNKMDAFVETSIDYQAGRCATQSVQQSSLRVTLRNDPPVDLVAANPGGNYGYYVDPSAPAGTTRMLVHMYVPVGANYQQSTIDGVEAPMFLATERNRPVWWTYVELAAGQEQVLDVRFEEPTVLAVQPQVRVQPMVIDPVVRVTETRAC